MSDYTKMMSLIEKMEFETKEATRDVIDGRMSGFEDTGVLLEELTQIRLATKVLEFWINEFAKDSIDIKEHGCWTAAQYKEPPYRPPSSS